jgi:hypothetical protein
MLGREQLLDRRIAHDRHQERHRHVARQQALAVLGEHRHVPHGCPRGIRRTP